MKKLSVKDLINTGVFSVLILLTYFLAGAIAHIPVLMPFLPFWCAIVAAIPYMLYTTKIEKFGMLSITMVLFIALFSLSGHGLYVLPGGIIAALIAELLLKKGNYKSRNYARWSYVAFNLFSSSIYLPLFIAKESVAKRWLDLGRSEEQIQLLFSYFPNWMLPVIIILALIGAYFGATVGIKVLEKHFKKAGMI